MERNTCGNVGFRIPCDVAVPRGRQDRCIRVPLRRYDVDFLSREYTLYYKVGSGDKEDRHVECIFVQWRVSIGDMFSLSLSRFPPLSLSLSRSRSRSLSLSVSAGWDGVSRRLRRAKCNDKFLKRGRAAIRERSTYSDAEILKIFSAPAIRDAKQAHAGV